MTLKGVMEFVRGWGVGCLQGRAYAAFCGQGSLDLYTEVPECCRLFAPAVQQY